MSDSITTTIKWNPQKVKAVRGNDSITQFAEKIGLSTDFLSKVERGQRKFSIDALAEFCAKTNRYPNDFFDIIVKES